MWRRACLGDRDAAVGVGYLWVGLCIAVLVVVAARTSWPVGIGCSAAAAVVMQAGYWWRRRRWDRWIRRQGLEGIAAVEVLLRQRSQG
ncbi:MAG: hypothetical protein U0R76_17555 [Candidatus Nanopelagicales bacterium]